MSETELYCRVERGEVVEGPRPLPRTWGRVSNLPALGAAELEALGWLPATITRAELPDADHRHWEPELLVEGAAVRVYYPAVPMTREELAERDRAAAEAEKSLALAAGAEYQGKRIALDAGSRADLAGMAVTAVAAILGAVPWPESYARGWITEDNTRIALATPEDGLALAAAAGVHYATVVQLARDRKDLATSEKEGAP